MNKETNVFMALLDNYFNDEEIKINISNYLKTTCGATKWMLYSDYCLDDKSKPNDVVTFALMPFKSTEHYQELQKAIATLQPTDIKKTKQINSDFLHLIKDESIFMFSFILEERKSFFGTKHTQRVSNIKGSLQIMVDCYNQWCSTAINDEILSYYKSIVTVLSSKIDYLNHTKSPNVKLLGDILFISFIGAYISYKILENVDVDMFGWFSDRDKIISGEDNIVLPIFNYYLFNMWRGERQYQFCTKTPDDKIKPFYEEFNRMVDVVTGAIADYDFKNNSITADKFNTVLVDFAAENVKYEVFRFFVEKNNIHLVRGIFVRKEKWGFLRETTEKAKKAGVDADTGLHRTGLEEYLNVIYPGRTWIHDKAFGEHNGKYYRIRPDYRCDEEKLIVEFDGLPHYQKPDVIKKDFENEEKYKNNGYKVVRIPYFIQLTNEVVKQLFGVEVQVPLFDDSIPSMGPKGQNTPAYCCPLGLHRMALEISKFPQQRQINIDALEKAGDDCLTGLSLLKKELCLIEGNNE